MAPPLGLGTATLIPNDVPVISLSSLGSQQSFTQAAYIVKNPLDEHFIIQEVFSVIPPHTTQSSLCVLCIASSQDFIQTPAWAKFELCINSTTLRLMLTILFLP